MVSTRRLIPLVMIVLTIGAARLSVQAADLRVTLPKRSALTTVQRLNREGVDAVRKQHYEKAETLFYKAYLFDPADPFTLYNLGYVSELQGQVERAQKFYGLATEQATDAVIDRSSAKQLSGKSMKDAFGVLKDVPMQVNRMNVEAIRLLSEGRAPEADLLLQQALALDAGNLFTLNNMGVAKEARGDFDDALTYYVAAANAQSPEPVIVTMNRAWRGKPVSKMAADSAKKLRTRIQNATSDQSRAALLSMRGVAATNRNDLSSLRLMRSIQAAHFHSTTLVIWRKGTETSRRRRPTTPRHARPRTRISVLDSRLDSPLKGCTSWQLPAITTRRWITRFLRKTRQGGWSQLQSD